MELVANQIIVIRRDRIIYNPVTLASFEDTTGLSDVASGSTVAHLDNLDKEAAAAGCAPERDGTCGVQPPAAAPAAPIAAFGLRIGTNLLPAVDGQKVGNQRVVGRIAFDLTEQDNSPGVGGEKPEIMRFVIDHVEMATDADGRLTTVRLTDGAQIEVYGRTAAGIEVRDTISAPADTVRLLPLTKIPDSMGDTHSIVLLIDLETGFSQAGTKFAALQNIAGHFTTHITLSAVEKIIRSPAGGLPQKDLIGSSITVNTQPPVSGGGLNGSAWIRMYPM